MEATITKTETSVLRSISQDGNTSYKKLGRLHRLSQGAIREIVTKLEDLDLVTREGYGRGITRVVTPEGMIFLHSTLRDREEQPKGKAQATENIQRQPERTEARPQNQSTQRPRERQQIRNSERDPEESWRVEERERLNQERKELDRQINNLQFRRNLVDAQLRAFGETI